MRRSLCILCRSLALPLAAAMLLLAVRSVRFCLEVPPAETYVDEGVHTFTASSGYPTTREGYYQKKYHRYSEQHVYVVVYEAPGGWRWTQDFLVEAEGKRTVQDREQVERRVLSLAEGEGFLTVDPRLTPQRYVSQERQRYLTGTGICLAVLAAEGAIALLLRRKKAHTA